jgi:hypothetical protein
MRRIPSTHVVCVLTERGVSSVLGFLRQPNLRRLMFTVRIAPRSDVLRQLPNMQRL